MPLICSALRLAEQAETKIIPSFSCLLSVRLYDNIVWSGIGIAKKFQLPLICSALLLILSLDRCKKVPSFSCLLSVRLYYVSGSRFTDGNRFQLPLICSALLLTNTVQNPSIEVFQLPLICSALLQPIRQSYSRAR